MSMSIIKSPVSFLLRSITSFGNNSQQQRAADKSAATESAMSSQAASRGLPQEQPRPPQPTSFSSPPLSPLRPPQIPLTSHPPSLSDGIPSPSSLSDASTSCDSPSCLIPVANSRQHAMPMLEHQASTLSAMQSLPPSPTALKQIDETTQHSSAQRQPYLSSISLPIPSTFPTCHQDEPTISNPPPHPTPSSSSCLSSVMLSRKQPATAATPSCRRPLTPPSTPQHTSLQSPPHNSTNRAKPSFPDSPLSSCCPNLSPRVSPAVRCTADNLTVLRRQLSRCDNLARYHFHLGKTVGTGSFGRVCVAEMDPLMLRYVLVSPTPLHTLPPVHTLPNMQQLEPPRSNSNVSVPSPNSFCPVIPLVLKILYKSKVIKLKQVDHVKDERRILSKVSHPFIINLIASFQDQHRLYMLMEYVNGGELFSYLRRCGRIPPVQARFFSAELVCAFSYLHVNNIVYRDLKPENLLIDAEGHIKIADFGFAKRVPPDDRTFTLCGTHEYLAPETIVGKGHGIPVDWWALGILIFEMLAGHPPFYDEAPVGIYKRILAGKIDFPIHIDSASRSLIRRLLVADPTKRLGCLQGGAQDVSAHRFYKGVDWQHCIQRLIPPPFVPAVRGPLDTSMFDDYPESKDDGSDAGGRGSGDDVGSREQDLCFRDF
eukprot:GHVS01072980.1.p1 GENE.GHVS01072980.1~~GHVS01072980.1.p1  ORF type:complete len:655 (+),score=99.17 GHVS01072980.1:253-2217(+)